MAVAIKLIESQVMASKYSIVEDTILKCHSHTTVGLALVIANDYKYEGMSNLRTATSLKIFHYQVVNLPH